MHLENYIDKIMTKLRHLIISAMTERYNDEIFIELKDTEYFLALDDSEKSDFEMDTYLSLMIAVTPSPIEVEEIFKENYSNIIFTYLDELSDRHEIVAHVIKEATEEFIKDKIRESLNIEEIYIDFANSISSSRSAFSVK